MQELGYELVLGMKPSKYCIMQVFRIEQTPGFWKSLWRDAVFAPLMVAWDEAGWFLSLLFNFIHSPSPGATAFILQELHAPLPKSVIHMESCHHALAFDVSVCVHSCFWPDSLVSCLPKCRRYDIIRVSLLSMYLLTMSNCNGYQFYKQRGEKNFLSNPAHEKSEKYQ